MNLETRTAAEEWRSGWTLVLAASFGFSFFSIMLAATGLFMGPLSQEFGWSRTLLSAGPSIATTMTAITGPFFGALLDKYGTRRLVLPGMVATMLAICGFSFLDGSETQWIILWVVFGLVSVTIKSTGWTSAVVSVFHKARGMALGMTLAGTAVAQIFVPVIGNFLIEEFGWRAAYVWLALGWGGITMVLCLFFFFDARERTVGTQAEKAAQAKAASQAMPGLTIPQAWRSSALWRLAISNFVVMLLTMGLGVHLFPILTEAGISRGYAATLMSLAGIAGILGKVTTGYFLDNFRPNWVGGLTLGVASVTFVLLMENVHSPVLIVIAIMINGYAAAAKTHITSFLTAEYAGMKNFGAIYGFMSSLMALASGLGPLMAGWIYDTTGDYNLFLIIGAIGCAIGGAIMITMPAYPDFGKESTAAQDETDAFA